MKTEINGVELAFWVTRQEGLVVLCYYRDGENVECDIRYDTEGCSVETTGTGSCCLTFGDEPDPFDIIAVQVLGVHPDYDGKRLGMKVVEL